MGSTADEPSFGRRLIPTLIDETAYANPNGIYCFLPKGTAVEHGFDSVTYNGLANAIDRCSHWMEAQLGRGQSFNTVAYLGPSDLLTTIIIVAAIKTGHKALLASPRNSLHAHVNLLDSTQCHILITPATAPPVTKEILSQRQMRHVLVPSLQNWLREEAVSVYPYEKTFEEARYEPFVVVHTSGSTGLPKPVIVAHGTVSGSDAFNSPPSDPDRNPIVFEAIRNKCVFVSLPPFHIAGIDFILAKPFYYGVIPVLAPSNIPVTAQLADVMHNLDFIECSIVAPSVLQELAETPSYLDSLRRLSCIMYGGGPLAKCAGDSLRQCTNLYNLMGGSEMYCVVSEIVDQEDWEYLKLSPMMGSEFRYQSEALWELCFIKESAFDLYQSIFTTYPELSEYRTNDLYSKHPTKPNLWRYEGRADDIIALSNGEKFNPVAMESLITAHPDVKSVLVFGQGRFQPGLLVEAKMRLTTDSDRASLKESMWPIIAQANNDCVAHGRLSRDMILFTDSSKPFLRAGKGSVQRRLTLGSFDQEIKQLYEAANDQITLAHDLPKKRLDGPLRPWLRSAIMATANWKTLKDEDDFFALGMDSLQVLNLGRQINSLVIDPDSGISMIHITAKAIYSNPTIDKLATVIQRSSQPHKKSCINGDQSPRDNFMEMQALLSMYSRDLPKFATPAATRQSDQPISVLMTGSTGSIGSYVLDGLLRSPKVHSIYCLNRSTDAERRQLDSHSAKGLSTAWNSDRVTFLQSQVSKPNLGLTPQTYQTLLANVTHILHNAWPVDFNLPLSSFAPHLLGVRHFIDFCARSPLAPSVFFVSSISAAMDAPSPVPERILTSFADAAPMAYAQSKHLAERLLDAANRTCGIKSAICRVGQVAGPVLREHQSGMWNKQEWLPSLIASSKFLGRIPETLGPNELVDWIPVDLLSKIVIELLLPKDCATPPTPNRHHVKAEEPPPPPPPPPPPTPTVYHAVNPHTTPWSELLPAILASIHDQPPPEPVTLRDWVAALATSAVEHEEHVDRNPAVKLLGFFEQLASGEGNDAVRFETAETVGASKALGSLEAVKAEWMVGWMRQWVGGQ
ncbi:MAG: hypothetical protein ALECFALPRED_008933 [Alectoria fallacina]|uniref:Uncharacterized protein n=1 Tax=Alectoria fallacina TaxID=1903189 RepID=A0A8H3IF74_9LECA|nr:MAG: hypothetical protein ALECFALPRED_008933 [Alectoria fallacina]